MLHDRAPLPGISAVLLPVGDLDSTVLDLVAVLEGLVGDQFEILLVAGDTPPDLGHLQARGRGLPLRVVDGMSLADGCDAATYELIFIAAPDGAFDVRELNHLFDDIEDGVDAAVGYRPHRTDVLVRQLQRWGWTVDLDFAFALIRNGVWQRLKREGRVASCCTELLASIRRLGFRVHELPVSHRRPTIGTPVSTGWRAA